MTPEEMRIAIAEACGWHDVCRSDKGLSGIAGFRETKDVRCDWRSMAIPDYLTDLNACHEMEKVLTKGEYAAYCSRLADLFSRACGYEWDDGYVGAIHATAAQRAEAFCRTLFPERFK